MTQSSATDRRYKIEDIQRWIDWLKSNSPKSAHDILNRWQEKLNRIKYNRCVNCIINELNDFHKFVKLEQEQWSPQNSDIKE